MSDTQHISGAGGPLEAARSYRDRVTELYWKRHDIAGVVAAGKEGIAFCLEQARAAGIAAEIANELRSIAKGIAYNVGSFTWPGWDEPGIRPAPDQLAFGKQCADLNLQLAIELEKPADRVAMAHWLVGAHALCADRLEDAVQAFHRAGEIAPMQDGGPSELYAGYAALARFCMNREDQAARSQFDRIVAELGSRADKDSQAYAHQLLAAKRVITGHYSK